MIIFYVHVMYCARYCYFCADFFLKAVAELGLALLLDNN